MPRRLRFRAAARRDQSSRPACRSADACSVRLSSRWTLCRPGLEMLDKAFDRDRLAEDVSRHETKNRIVDFAVFRNRQVRSIVCWRYPIRPGATEWQCRIGDPADE